MRFALLPLLGTLLLPGCGNRATNSTAQASGKRMIVLGVDGMDPAFLEAHWSSLPNLNRLHGQGDFRRLATTVPPQSPVAWTSVITGMDPGGHGIFDFVHRNPATRMPMSSMAEVTEPTRTVGIGPYVIPLTGGGVRSLRSGRAFWQILADEGVRSRVIRMPANFPPAECEEESLSGMGTPDMTGSFGTFSFFTDDPAESRTQVAGGRIARVKVENGRTALRIEGPANSLRKDGAIVEAQLIAHIDPTEAAARFELDGQQFILRQGEWSDWVRANFRLMPGVKQTGGILRVYLQQVHPYLRIYVSPVNVDPDAPALPISTPPEYSRRLAEAVGPYYTQGIAEETSAFRAGLLSRAEFLQQSHKVLADSLRMFRYELDRYQGGLLFYYFSSVDQNSHMLWGRYEADLLEIYRAIDGAIGDAMTKAGSDTELVVLSDHGFANFDRTVHLNTFLMQEGLLALDDPANVGDAELFAHVDWTRTLAYAIGLNGIYINLESRENGGVVPAADRRQVLDRIARRLKEFKDPVRGENVVDQVYFPEETFQGKNLRNAPDLFVGFRRGYRASWQTALGAVPPVTLEDNTQAWIGDHCMASDEVPGVLLSNRKMRATAPKLTDVTATILNEFGVQKPANMIGQTIF